MKDKLIFSPEGWLDYLYWQGKNKKTMARINQLIKDIQRNGPMKGIGKPEVLKHRDGWSRRIDDTNRLIYTLENDTLLIMFCRGHYEDK